MSQVSFGDLASFYRNQLNNARLKINLQTLGQELASGVTSDLGEATGGDLGNYAGLETALNALGSYKTSTSEASLFAESIQNSLKSVQDTASDMGSSLLLAGSSDESTLVQTTASDARERFASVVSMLNTRVGDRSLLAGAKTDKAPLADSELMLADLQTAISAETTSAGVIAIVDSWFDDAGGGFETTGYLGGTDDLAPFRIGQNDKVTLSLRADDQSVRDVLKGFAMAALVADGALAASPTERTNLITAAGTQLLTSDYGLSESRAGVGVVEARIESAKARNSAEKSALEIARSEIVSVDPYRAATELQAAETQLQSLYTITARLSQLNLTEYLR